MTSPMIDIHNLTVRKQGHSICSVASLEIMTGERITVCGGNGSGKTTLLRVLAGLEREFAGTVRVGAKQDKRGLVQQAPYLLRGSVLFNVVYGLRQRAHTAAERHRMAMHWLQRFGLQRLSLASVTHLSSGERRRVALARTMILEPSLLLLDEPLSDLDELGRAAFGDALNELDQTTILIASPDPLAGHEWTTRQWHLSALPHQTPLENR